MHVHPSSRAAVCLLAKQLHKQLKLDYPGVRGRGGLDAASMSDDRGALAEGLHCREKLHIARRPVHAHHTTRYVHVRGSHTLQPQQRVGDQSAILLARERLHGEHDLSSLVEHPPLQSRPVEGAAERREEKETRAAATSRQSLRWCRSCEGIQVLQRTIVSSSVAS